MTEKEGSFGVVTEIRQQGITLEKSWCKAGLASSVLLHGVSHLMWTVHSILISRLANEPGTSEQQTTTVEKLYLPFPQAGSMLLQPSVQEDAVRPALLEPSCP